MRSLGAVGLGGLTYGLIEWPGQAGSPAVVLALLFGVGGLVGFVWREHSARAPMLPLGIFSSRVFTATNLVTFAVYAALSAIFFFLVLTLQVVAGFSPLEAGAALLPVTVLMLLLSLADGRRWPRASDRGSR